MTEGRVYVCVWGGGGGGRKREENGLVYFFPLHA